MDMGYYERVVELTRLIPEHRAIGRSVFGREIICFGSDDPRLTIVGGVHAREMASTELCIGLLKIIKTERSRLPVSVIPLLNPDGIGLVERGTDSVPTKYGEALKGFDDFSKWKANGRGVDLNVNFDADWGEGVGNVRQVAEAGYIGERPFSEPESIAIRDYLDTKKPPALWCLHARGEVVYYGYNDIGDGRQAQKVAALFGYAALTSRGSTGGIKDWYTLAHGADGYAVTIEIGPDDRGYVETAQDAEYMDRIKNRVYGYLVSEYS